ncbi:uncharacterized protein LOC112345530 isoform X3 [Selaginella moellendorffii]|uniref:uncharacterized protein LOC112345530 isoform X3 n=1 Tax=Selaginella moellendorffii TaxID=88036 RepID=UPI000D1D0360|nr:uncharacterized protein LOC112345530 isoform X3 [Selaginella moellendorffii]|eukprot:XP_024528220.1 uncharacterized protein LOC112345530 isoform X3 [Selaginella moellendorffii]
MVVLAPGIHTNSGKRESLALAVVDGLYRWREIVGPCGNSRLLGGRICGTKRELSLSAERSRMRTLVWDGTRPELAVLFTTAGKKYSSARLV